MALLARSRPALACARLAGYRAGAPARRAITTSPPPLPPLPPLPPPTQPLPRPPVWAPPPRLLEALRWSANHGPLDQRFDEMGSVGFWREAQTVTQGEARAVYLLRSADLEPLPALYKTGAHAQHSEGGQSEMIPLYFRMDVVRAALARHGSMERVAVRKSHRELVRARRMARRQTVFIGTRLKRDAAREGGAAVPVGQHAVYAALVVNALIAVGKGLACSFTGSGVLFAETVHSCADLLNQVGARVCMCVCVCALLR
jgi:hypothetical protein